MLFGATRKTHPAGEKRYHWGRSAIYRTYGKKFFLRDLKAFTAGRADRLFLLRSRLLQAFPPLVWSKSDAHAIQVHRSLPTARRLHLEVQALRGLGQADVSRRRPADSAQKESRLNRLDMESGSVTTPTLAIAYAPKKIQFDAALMAGYTPVFDSIYTGTLYGKWPTAAVWASLLPLFDKNGVLDLSIDAICGMTGWPRDLMEQGINALMQPDPHSRTKDEDGRRMVLLDPDRAWGWRAVNHATYREKARLQAKSAKEVADGRNAGRMKDRRGPPGTAADPLSNANANTDSNKNSEVRSESSLHLHVSGSSLAQKPQERLKKSSEEGSGREKLRELTRSLAQSKALPKPGRARSPPAANAARTEPQRQEGTEDRQR